MVKGEPMDDLISRQAAIDTLESGKDRRAKGDIGGFYNAIIQNDIDKLRNLPSAQRWIPCSERLPEARSGLICVTVLDESGDTAFTYSSVGFYLGDGCWIVDNEPMYEGSLMRVIAWMSLPEPYQEGGQDENR